MRATWSLGIDILLSPFLLHIHTHIHTHIDSCAKLMQTANTYYSHAHAHTHMRIRHVAQHNSYHEHSTRE
jgi:hypothetical protein